MPPAAFRSFVPGVFCGFINQFQAERCQICQTLAQNGFQVVIRTCFLKSQGHAGNTFLNGLTLTLL